MSRNIRPACNETPCASDKTRPLLPTTTQWNPPKLKRKLTGSACEYCRKRRRRCNGERPCTNCRAHDQVCVYEVVETKTPDQALKRKYAQIEQERDELRTLFNLISTAQPKESIEIFQRMQSGQNYKTILNHVQRGDVLVQTQLHPEQHARQMLLSNLMQTTASFDELVHFIATSMKDISNMKIPHAAQFRSLRGQQVDLKMLAEFMGWPIVQRRISISDLVNDPNGSSSSSGSSPRPSSSSSSSSSSNSSTSTEGIVQERAPPFRVPAAPWTRVIDDDDLVSHLVSVYLEWLNPGWRQVEQDLFLGAMRSGDLNSEYCSPLLVNSILAFASLNSERDGVFFVPDDYMTRGQQFHDEALRQWETEKKRPCIATICGLCVFFINCVVRGQDKVGVQSIGWLEQAEDAVPLTLVNHAQIRNPSALEIATYSRARRNVSWAALSCDMATANTLLKPGYRTSFPDGLSSTSELPPSVPTWTGYPTQSSSKPLDRNELWLEFCRLNQLTWKAQRLLYASDRDDPYFHQHIEELTRDMMHWKRSLPQSLQYRSTLPAPVFDLYSFYYSILMALYSLFAPLVYDKPSSPPSPSPTPNKTPKPIDPAHMREQSFACAREMSSIISDYRRTYGLKLIVPYMIQANGLSCFTLLQDLKTPSSQLAFKEAFRCLLGIGMHFLWARGMARMLHLTAQQTGIPLPPAITTMLAAVADTAWKKTDTELLSSCWPNYVIAKEGKEGEFMMEDLIKKWEKLDVDVQGDG